MLTIKSNSLWYRLALYGTLRNTSGFREWEAFRCRTICEFMNLCLMGVMKIALIILFAVIAALVISPAPLLIIHGLITGIWWYEVISDGAGMPLDRLIILSFAIWILTAILSFIIVCVALLAHFYDKHREAKKYIHTPSPISLYLKGLKEKVCFSIKIV